MYEYLVLTAAKNRKEKKRKARQKDLSASNLIIAINKYEDLMLRKCKYDM